MSGGSEIKSVITLDVSKFTSAIEKATGNLDALDGQLKSAGKVSKEFEKQISSIASGTSETVNKFKQLSNTLTSFSGQLDKIASGFTSFSGKSSAAEKSVDALGSAVKRMTDISADGWIRQYGDQLDKLSPVLKKTVSSIVDFDRANIASADTAERSAARTSAAKLRSLTDERDANAKIIAERQKLVNELNALQERMDSRASAHTAIARRYFGKNADAGTSHRQNAADAVAAASAAASEAQAVSAVVAELKWKNSEIEKTIRLTKEEQAASAAASAEAKRQAQAATEAKRIEQAAARAARDAARESAIAARQAADERIAEAKRVAEAERASAEQIKSIWKGMASLWAASKVEHGFGASVSSADSMQREQMLIQGLNIPKDQIDYITKKAWDDSKVLKFASALDMVKARIAMMSGMPNVGQAQIDQMLPSAAKVAHNIAYITGDHSKAGFENMIRNISGVIEARGQTRDVAAAKATMDLIQKIYLGTGRKIDIADLETFLRRDNLGANTITDKGLAQMVSFLDEVKVSGGHGGGGASGVSTAGTALKMIQKMANGGKMTEGGATLFAKAGLLNMDNVHGTGKERMKSMTTAGLNVATLMDQMPVAAVQEMAKKLFAYMSRPENVKKYYGNLNPNSEEGRRAAMRRAATETGWSVNSQTMLVAAGDADKMNRANAQAEKLLAAQGGDQLNAQVMKTYGGNMDAFKAALTNLKVTVGNELLPVLSKLAHYISKIVTAADSFAKDNKMVLDMTMLGVAAGGAVLALKGFVSLMGMPGKLTTMFTAMIPAMRGVSAEAAAADGALAGNARALDAIPGSATKAAGAYEVFSARVSESFGAAAVAQEAGTLKMDGRLRLLGATTMETAKLIGKGFLRMIPLVGELLIAWDFASLLSHVEVGGHEISQWMGKWLDDMLTGAEGFWDKFLSLFESGTAKAARLAKIAADEQAKEQRDQANGFAPVTPSKKDQLAARSSDMLAIDRHNSPNVDPITGQPWAAQKLAIPKQSFRRDNSTVINNDTHNTTINDGLNSTAAGDGSNFVMPASDAKKHKYPYNYEDLFNRQYQVLVGRAKDAALKLSSIDSGQTSYSDQAKSAVFGQWSAGNFDHMHDPANRGEFLKRGITYNPQQHKYLDSSGAEVTAANAVDWNKKGGSGKSLSDMADEQQKILELTDAQKSLSFAKERSNSLSQEAAISSENVKKNAVQETLAMRALRREYARLEGRNPQAALASKDANSQYYKDKQSALMSRSIIDMNKFTGTANTSAEAMATRYRLNNDGTIITRTQKIDQAMQRSVNKLDDNYKTAATVLDAQMALYSKDSDEYKAAVKAKKAASDAYNLDLLAIKRTETEALATPNQLQQERWKTPTDQIDNMTASWGGNLMGGLDSLMNGTIRTRHQFNRVGVNMLTNGLQGAGNVLINQAMGGMVGDAATGLGNLEHGASDYLTKILGGSPNSTAGGSAGGSSIMSTGINALKGFWTSLTGAKTATDGLGKSAAEAAAKGASELLGTTQKMTAEQTATLGMTTLATAAQTAATALASIGGSSAASSGGSMLGGLGGLLGGGATTAASTAATDSVVTASPTWVTGASAVASMFADGGIMTNYGPVSLKKYANGGIANSPQLALFGEAGPEAYVPLPDGRSIPVSLQGNNVNQNTSTNQGVTISIVVNTADNTSSSSSVGTKSSQAGWSQAADQIKAIVLQQLVTQQRPGGVLYK